MADGTITQISIGVKADTAKAEQRLEALSDKMLRIRDVANAGISPEFAASLQKISEAMAALQGVKGTGITQKTAENVNLFAASLRNLTTVDADGLQRIANASGKVANTAWALQNFKGTGITKSLCENIMRLGISLESLTKVDAWKLHDIAESLKMIGTASLESANASFKAAASSAAGLATTTLPDVAKSEEVVSNAIDNTTEAMDEQATESAETGSALGRLGQRVASITERFHNFLASLKRIAVYRAIRWVLKSITQGFREGIQNMYQYSTLIDGTFKKSMDTLSTSALYLKNSLGALVAPIVNALAPAIDIIVDKFVDLLNIITETIATISGAATWTKALKYPKEYAEAMDGASGSAKALRATLLGFDEINRLDDATKGARGAAADMLDYSKMFEEVATEGMSGVWDQIFGVGKTKFGVFAGGAATLFALKLGGAFDGLFGIGSSTGLLGKFTAVLLAAFGGWTLGNWLYENNIGGIRDWADRLMEKLGPKIDVVVGWINEKFSKIDIGLGLELLAEDIVEFENSVKDGWGIIVQSAKGYFDKVHNWMIEWGYALMDFHDIRINFHTSVDSTEWDTFQKKVSGELDKMNDQIQSAHQNAYNFTGSLPYGSPNAGLYQQVDYGRAVVKNMTNEVTDKLSKAISSLTGIKLFASGGTPETGTLFLARESGPEIVAQVGHKTQVANNDQIVRSIQTATENANAEGNYYLAQAVSLLQRISDKDTTVVANITADSITSGLERQNRRSGRTVVPIGG
jgi:hypothetical protein